LAPEWALFRLVVGGHFLPNFELANMISTNTKDFSWKKKGSNLSGFEIFFPPNHRNFMINSSR
jgi:hypothetical protein